MWSNRRNNNNKPKKYWYLVFSSGKKNQPKFSSSVFFWLVDRSVSIHAFYIYNYIDRFVHVTVWLAWINDFRENDPCEIEKVITMKIVRSRKFRRLCRVVITDLSLENGPKSLLNTNRRSTVDWNDFCSRFRYFRCQTGRNREKSNNFSENHWKIESPSCGI